MEIAVNILGFLAILASAYVLGILLSKIKLPAILGWLIAGIVLGPYLGQLVSLDFINNTWFKIVIHAFELFAGLMIGRELNLQKLKKTGTQILVTTLFQSLGTFLVVSLFFLVTLAIAHKPLYLAFLFGGIALATAPAPALSIVDQYKTDGPVTRTLIPMAALDDVVGVIVFFTTISIVSGTVGSAAMAWWMVVLMILLPFAIGIAMGFLYSFLAKVLKNTWVDFFMMLFFMLMTLGIAVVCNKYLFKSDALNCFLTGMAFTAVPENMLDEKKMQTIEKRFHPILSLSLLIVIVDLGMPLDYHSIAGAGIYTLIYIVSRAIGKIGGASLGSRIMKMPKTVSKYLGLTLLPHSGVSLVFTGIAVNTLVRADPESATLIQGTITAAAVINELIAVVLAKVGFTEAGEIGKAESEEKDSSVSASTKASTSY